VNALIVDDERLARNELRRLLTAHADVTIVGEASNGDEAEARLAAADVDVLFLDIQMPGANGFELLERLDRVPLVIFTTAYDEYAVRAFEVNAFDYLLKPIRPERLSVALEKARVAWSALRAEKANPQKRT
jgi:two-component system LytT family response regulator